MVKYFVIISFLKLHDPHRLSKLLSTQRQSIDLLWIASTRHLLLHRRRLHHHLSTHFLLAQHLLRLVLTCQIYRINSRTIVQNIRQPTNVIKWSRNITIGIVEIVWGCRWRSIIGVDQRIAIVVIHFSFQVLLSLTRDAVSLIQTRLDVFYILLSNEYLLLSIINFARTTTSATNWLATLLTLTTWCYLLSWNLKVVLWLSNLWLLLIL